MPLAQATLVRKRIKNAALWKAGGTSNNVMALVVSSVRKCGPPKHLRVDSRHDEDEATYLVVIENRKRMRVIILDQMTSDSCMQLFLCGRCVDRAFVHVLRLDGRQQAVKIKFNVNPSDNYHAPHFLSNCVHACLLDVTFQCHVAAHKQVDSCGR